MLLNLNSRMKRLGSIVLHNRNRLLDNDRTGIGTRVDEMNMQIITIEGFVFAPKYDKRNPLRQLEAMIYSLLLPHEVNEVVITVKK